MTAFADHELEKEYIKPSESVEKGKIKKIAKIYVQKISKRSHVLTNTTRMCSQWAPSQTPTLKFLTHPAPQVPPSGHHPSNRMEILFNMFSIFYL